MKTPTNWREHLQLDFKERRAKNPSFSLRSYAKTLAISPAHLSLILSGKRKVKAKSALQVASSLGLTPTETFSMLEQDSGTRKKMSMANLRILNPQEFNLISQWYYYAILGLAALQTNVADPQWIAVRLSIPLFVAKKAFYELVDLKYLEVKQGQFRQSTPTLRTTDDVSVQAIRRYHKQNLQLAAEKIDGVDVLLREYTSMTLAINPKRLEVAKKMIRKFKEEFTEEMSRGKKTEVYNLCIQFFPLTQPSKKGNM